MTFSMTNSSSWAITVLDTSFWSPRKFRIPYS
jgi:hypothetical protein